METKPISPWFTAITCSAILAVGGGIIISTLHEEVMGGITHSMKEQREAFESLQARLQKLEAQSTSVAAKQEAPQPAVSPAAQEVIQKLTARLEALETRPLPVANAAAAPTTANPSMILGPVPDTFPALRKAVLSGKDFTVALDAFRIQQPTRIIAPALEKLAPRGITPEKTLRSELNAILAATSPPLYPVRDGYTGQINDYFAGYVLIKKKPETDPYANLRRSVRSADLRDLRDMVRALPDDVRAPLSDWLERATLAADARAALDILATPVVP